MKEILNLIAGQLKCLEQLKHYIKKSENGFAVPLKVFLLSISADKPAVTLLQNTASPNAAYGCHSCDIKGITAFTKIGGWHRIPVFSTLNENVEQPSLRTNETYDEIISFLGNLDISTIKTRRQKQMLFDRRKGHHGPCSLRTLKYFDVGLSFVFDILHNLDGGVC
ncbi:unnamed protein product, partial [Didymodactylos carnosus]